MINREFVVLFTCSTVCQALQSVVLLLCTFSFW